MENQNEVSTEIIEQEKQVVAQIVAEAEAVVIKTEQENQVVANKIVGYRDALKRVEEKVMAGPRETKRQATATVANLEALFVKPIEQALKLLRDKSARFYAAEEARRAELQRKEDAKFDKAAARSEATGKPLTVAPKIIAKVQTEGVSYRTTYFAEVVDMKKLCAAIAAGTVDVEAVEPVFPFLNAKAKARKTAGDEIYPGVFCRSKKVVG